MGSVVNIITLIVLFLAILISPGTFSNPPVDHRHLLLSCLSTLEEIVQEILPYVEDTSLPKQHALISDSDIPVTYISQEDFNQGTLRLKESGIYRLTSDVTFAPAAPWPNCATQHNLANYCDEHSRRLLPQFHLGFFAAVTLEGQNVYLDLNGFTIKQSLRHSLQQRFFAIIETSSSPFVMGQGPGKFTRKDTPLGCVRCSITNGTVGLTSHHGIHGVQNQDLVMRDLVFRDYEVAAISLNAPHRLLIENVLAQGQNTQVHARATLSASRFLLLFYNSVPTSTPLPPSLVKAAEALQALEDNFINAVVQGSDPSPEAEAQFGNVVVSNAQKLVDGNAYGIVIHGHGVAVNQFGETRPSDFSNDSSDVTIRNTEIHDVSARVTEVCTIKNKETGKPMMDVAGSVLRIDDLKDADENFALDTLHRLRFEYASFVNDLPPPLVSHARGTMNIDEALVEAYKEGELESAFMSYEKHCNADSMNHAQKGTIGLFVQRTKNLALDNIKIMGVTNYGPLGSDVCGPYTTSQWTGHSGYTGTQSYGMVLTTSRNINLIDLSIDSVYSEEAAAYGIAIFNGVDHVHAKDPIKIRGITSNFQNRGPNDPPRCHPVIIGEGVAMNMLTIDT